MRRLFRGILSSPPGVFAAGVGGCFLLVGLCLGGVIRWAPVVYASYFLSALALALLCIRLPAAIRALGRGLENCRPVRALLRDPRLRRLVYEPLFRTHVALYVGLGANLLYAGLKFGFGAAQRSSWLMVLGLYYTGLAGMKFSLLRHIQRKGLKTDLPAEWRRYRLCGAALFGMNLVLIAMVVSILETGAHASYPGVLIFAMAAYAFYFVISAFVSLLRAKRFRSPVYSAARFVSMTAALVSMLSLTAAMLARFGAGDSSGFSRAMNAAVGGGVCALVFGMSLWMLLRATRALKRETP